MAQRFLTKRERRARGTRRLAGVLVVVLLAFAGYFAYGQIADQLREQGEIAVRDSIINSAKQCCAIEGSYPSSLQYLVDNYGLIVNRNDYTITYEVFAANVMPSVMVLAR